MNYIKETQYAVETLLSSIFHEHDELAKITAERDSAASELAHMQRRLTFLELNPDLDDEGIGTSTFWDMHFDAGPALDSANSETSEIEQRIEARKNACSALCGRVLQIAKQGISTVHGNLSGPAGRNVKSQSLRDVIWQARNQSLHYEEGNCHPPVVSCFTVLADDFSNSELLKFNETNLSIEVIGILGWTSYSKYESDMNSMISQHT